MNPSGRFSGEFRRGIKIEGPTLRDPETEIRLREARKFLPLIPHEAEPNFGRVRELKDEIKKGTYVTRDVIEETSARLTIRFMRRE